MITILKTFEMILCKPIDTYANTVQNTTTFV